MKKRRSSRPGEQPYDAMRGETGSGRATPVARERNPTAPRVPTRRSADTPTRRYADTPIPADADTFLPSPLEEDSTVS